ncbi:MAG TPA: hypothetical protein VM841_04255 [Actinomycetota bacterium]|nr:hypothetical protein [Actinomycetota bacterium]
MRRLGQGFVVGAAFVLATGLWAPAGAGIVEHGIDSPADGEVTSTNVVPVQVRAESDSSGGLQYLRLELEGPGFSNRVVWCAPGPLPQCPAFSTNTKRVEGSQGRFNWDTTSLTTYNGDYTLKLVVKDNDGSIKTDVKQVRVNTPPAPPSWVSVSPTTTGGQAKMTLKWRANAEPDITSYRITRTSSNGGPSTFFKVEKDNPGGQGCSLASGAFTCTDTAFPASGYGGTYTYHLAATRHSPVTSSGVTSSQSTRAASVSEPKPSPSTGTGGGSGGGRGGGGGSTPGSGGGGFITPGPGGAPGASMTPTPDPDAVDPREFYTGIFDKSLPYKQRITVVLGQQERRNVAGFASEDDIVPLDVRKTLLPIAGGLFTLTAALHFRRVIRDH